MKVTKENLLDKIFEKRFHRYTIVSYFDEDEMDLIGIGEITDDDLENKINLTKQNNLD